MRRIFKAFSFTLLSCLLFVQPDPKIADASCYPVDGGQTIPTPSPCPGATFYKAVSYYPCNTQCFVDINVSGINVPYGCTLYVQGWCNAASYCTSSDNCGIDGDTSS